MSQVPSPDQSVIDKLTGGLDLNTTLKIEGKDVSVADLVAAHKELASSKTIVAEQRKFNEAARRLFKANELSIDEWESAVRVVMPSMGYTESQVDEYIATAKKAATTPTPDDESGGEAEDDARTPAERETEDRVSRLEAEEAARREQRRERIRTRLENAKAAALDSNAGLAKMVSGVQKRKSDAAAKALRDELMEDINDRALKLLKAKADKAKGQFDEDWITPAFADAAATVHARRLSVIEGLGLTLGRAPETVTGEEQISRSAPIALPDPKSIRDTGDAQEKFRQYAEDALKRALIESSEVESLV
jgi:PAS domain-containing protein